MWYYLFLHPYAAGTQNAFQWLVYAWQEEENAFMIPLLACYMLWHGAKGLKGTTAAFSFHGLWLVLLGGIMCVIAARSIQARIALAALPFLLTGGVWCYWGGQAARKCAFPFFFLWLCIPFPGLQQATVSLQLLATQAAHWGAQLFGVETIVEGTNISSADGHWDTYNIAGGCSGIRSLMVLLMFSITWGYLAHKLALWKRLLLGLSAIPLAIIANAIRVASIFVCAEYISPSFAGKTWHDWSGLLIFFPASLAGLILLHNLLSGELLLRKRKTVTRPSTPHLPPSDGKEAQP